MNIILMLSIIALIICIISTIINLKNLNEMDKYLDDLEERIDALSGEKNE